MLGLTQFTYVLLSKIHENTANEEEIRRSVRYILALDYMIKFYNLPKVINKSKLALLNETKMPKELFDHYISKFTSVSNFDGNLKIIKTQELILKLFFHCLIFAFILTNYEMNAGLLSIAMKIDNKDMYGKLRILNCDFPQVTKEKREEGRGKITKVDNLIAKLKAPLKINNEVNLQRKGKGK